MAESSAGPFEVSYLEHVRHQFQEWGQEAMARGFGPPLLAALRYIHDRLTADPLQWGEPQTNLLQLRLVVCDGFHERIHVRFSVHEDQRLVFVTGCWLLPGHPLEPNP